MSSHSKSSLAILVVPVILCCLLPPLTSGMLPSPAPVENSTCQTLRQLANTTGICQATSQCDGVHCVIGVGSFDIRVEPCHNPPAVHIVGRDITGNVVVNKTLTNSLHQNVGIGTLNVNIQQSPNEDSISISVGFTPLRGSNIPIIPETTIPLNRQQCPFVSQTQPMVSHPSTSTPAPTPQPRQTTCQALQQLASSSLVCSTNNQCSGLNCVLAGTGSFNVTVEPCDNPPALHIFGRNESGSVLVNETLNRSRQIDLVQLGTLNINILPSPDEDTISISVGFTPHIGPNIPIPIIPETTIPLNRQQCPPTTRMRPTATRISTPIATPASTPVLNTQTCQALQQLASSSRVCSTNSQCTGLHCEVLTYSIDIVVEPCYSPPAVKLIVADYTGRVLVNEIFNSSRTESFGFGSFDIHLEQASCEDSIMISVDVTFLGTSQSLIPRTTIPLNREQQCGYTLLSTATCSQLYHTTAPGHGSSLTASLQPTSTPTLMSTSSLSALVSTTATWSPSLFQSNYTPAPGYGNSPTLTASLQPTSTPTLMSTSLPPALVSTTATWSPSLFQSNYTPAPGYGNSPTLTASVQPTITPTEGANPSSTILAVALSVSMILGILGTVVLVGAIVLAVRKYKHRQREFHFQRMTLNDDIDGDDDDDEDL